jgi:hypothetical protein
MQVSSLLMYIMPPLHLQSNPPQLFLHEQCGQEHASFSLHSSTSGTASEMSQQGRLRLGYGGS